MNPPEVGPERDAPALEIRRGADSKRAGQMIAAVDADGTVYVDPDANHDELQEAAEMFARRYAEAHRRALKLEAERQAQVHRPRDLFVKHFAAIGLRPEHNGDALLYAVRSDDAIFGRVDGESADTAEPFEWVELPRVPGCDGFGPVLTMERLPSALEISDRLVAAARAAEGEKGASEPGVVSRPGPLDDAGAVSIPDPAIMLERIARVPFGERVAMFAQLGLLSDRDMEEVGNIAANNARVGNGSIDAEYDEAATARALRNALESGRLGELSKALDERDAGGSNG
jgi:hypothetical protein